MKYFKNYQIFNEAIKYRDVEKYLKTERKAGILERLDIIFNRLKRIKNSKTSKRDERIYIPFEYVEDPDYDYTTSETQRLVSSFLSRNGYEVVDYKRSGLATDGKRKMKIGKLLQMLTKTSGTSGFAKKLLKDYNNDSTRIGKNLNNKYIVFSRHPYDIAGMSTDRGWDSCMNITKGMYKSYVMEDIKEGTIVIYLISSNDMNINNPIARTSAKSFVNVIDSNDVLYFTEKVYGTPPPGFKSQVDKILEDIQDIKFGGYVIKSNLYCDSSIPIRFTSSKANTKEEIIQFLKAYKIKNYTINDDLTVDINDDIDLRNGGIQNIPIQFGIIYGSFDISRNNLTTLQGCPREVKGKFGCVNNSLINLQGGPQKVGSHYYCFENKLISLEGGPIEVGGRFDCSDNRVKSLQGSPQKVGGIFNCENNDLKTLDGGPVEVGENYICSYNQLISLSGSPEKIDGDFNCSHNELTTLENGPIFVKGNYECLKNKLTTLEGSPETVGKSFNCSNNQLTSFEGGPDEIGWSVRCNNNSVVISEDEILSVSYVGGDIFN